MTNSCSWTVFVLVTNKPSRDPRQMMHPPSMAQVFAAKMHGVGILELSVLSQFTSLRYRFGVHLVSSDTTLLQQSRMRRLEQGAKQRPSGRSI